MLFHLLPVAAMLFVQVCCIPPLEAAEVVCPITKAKCEASTDCDPPPPQAATSATAPVPIVPQVDGVPLEPPPRPEFHPPAEPLTFWSAPTRTIVLRI